jgi:SET domain-containing protein
LSTLPKAVTDKTDEFSFRLGASPIHGVGVFANHDIQSGVRLEMFAGETRYLDAAPTEEAARLLDALSVEGEEGRGYYCPQSFTRVDIGWYLNHSDAPNAGHVDWEYYALRDIQDGEEVTIDYRTLGEVGGVPEEWSRR